MDKYDSLKLCNQLCFPLYACSKEIIAAYKPYLDELDLTYTQYITLLVLWEHKELNVKEIGDYVLLDSGTLTPMLKKMESKGIISRNRSVNDERTVYIKLTKKGEELKDKALCIPSKMQACVNLSNDEAQSLHDILYKILNSLNQNKTINK